MKKSYYQKNKKKLKEKFLAKSRTREGLASYMYSGQKKSAKFRDQTQPDYSLEEFKEWLFSQSNFETLYLDWVQSNYDKWKKPSGDRLKNNLSYSLENLRLVTWKKNFESEHRDKCKKIDQLSLEGEFIKTWPSLKAAQKNLERGDISSVLRNLSNTAGGFKWRYNQESNNKN